MTKDHISTAVSVIALVVMLIFNIAGRDSSYTTTRESDLTAAAANKRFDYIDQEFTSVQDTLRSRDDRADKEDDKIAKLEDEETTLDGWVQSLLNSRARQSQVAADTMYTKHRPHGK